tara:strand:+ start:42 stop:146 length:105 start_codon:yes stop_codon:yes gene_type:complete
MGNKKEIIKKSLNANLKLVAKEYMDEKRKRTRNK